MQLTAIKTYEGKWQECVEQAGIPIYYPITGKSYRVRINTKGPVERLQKIWLGYSYYSRTEEPRYRKEDNPTDALYKGIVLEIATAEEYREIIFQVSEIMPDEDVLLYCPESEYPEELNEQWKSEYSGCNYMQNSISVDKLDTDSYDLNVDFYGCETNMKVRVIDGKMYAWHTSEGFEYLTSYYGKYLLPEWLKEIIESPHDNPLIRFKDYTK